MTYSGTAGQYTDALGNTITVTTTLAVDSSGQLIIAGLDEGEYYLEETTAPSGYVLPTGRFKIELVADTNNAGQLTVDNTLGSGYYSNFSAVEAADSGLVGTVTLASLTNSSNDLLAVTLKNSTTSGLPSTGGLGTILFTIGGVVLMIFAAWVFMNLRRLFAKYLN